MFWTTKLSRNTTWMGCIRQDKTRINMMRRLRRPMILTNTTMMTHPMRSNQSIRPLNHIWIIQDIKHGWSSNIMSSYKPSIWRSKVQVMRIRSKCHNLHGTNWIQLVNHQHGDNLIIYYIQKDSMIHIIMSHRTKQIITSLEIIIKIQLKATSLNLLFTINHQLIWTRRNHTTATKHLPTILRDLLATQLLPLGKNSLLPIIILLQLATGHLQLPLHHHDSNMVVKATLTYDLILTYISPFNQLTSTSLNLDNHLQLRSHLGTDTLDSRVLPLRTFTIHIKTLVQILICIDSRKIQINRIWAHIIQVI